jgi:uncharacterized protein with GYD domain
MPRYMIQASLTGEGLKGTLAEGGTARKAALEQTIASLGGTLETFYYSFGDSDVVGIADMPDNVSAAAFAVTVAAAGVAAPKTTVLLTAEEIDQVAAKAVAYRPPGG